jgi:mono/diheme cytochrome c family protein
MGLALGASAAQPDLTGSYAGELRTHGPSATAAAAAITETAGALSGTVALETADPTLTGAYLVQGKHKRRRVRLRGVSANGVRLVLRGRAVGDAIRGKVRLRLGKARVRGRIVLTRQSGGPDVSSCDGVFVDNEAFFTTDVMNGVLVPICAACHVAGGQAEAARLRVVPGDPAATAQTTLLVIDPTAPGDSLLLAKPLARLPHGGGQQIAEGSAQAQALAEWADLVAAADCSGPTAPRTGAELYAATCAGCHGADAAGLDGRPDVRCTVPSRLADAVRRGRGTGDTGMPSFPTAALSDEQLALIADHLAGLCSGLAADVYASNCATCHGATAAGGRNADGVRGPDIRCTGANDFPEVLADGEEGMPAFPTLAGSMAGELTDFVHTFCMGGSET